MSSQRKSAGLILGLALLAILCVGAATVFADKAAYSEILDICAESDLIKVCHHHDWSDNSRRERYAMISTHRDPFLADNAYAYIECHDRRSTEVLFKVPGPALTYIWISPDSKYIVGLSKVQLWNPYQLAVWDSTGKLLFKEHITPECACFSQTEYSTFISINSHLSEAFAEREIWKGDSVWVDYQFIGSPDSCSDSAWQVLCDHSCPSPYSSNFRETITNWVWWYNEDNPDIRCIEADGELLAISLLDGEGERIEIPLNRVIDAPRDRVPPDRIILE